MRKSESTTVSFRLSVEDKNIITDAALELEISMSDFMLMKIFQEDRLVPIYLETISKNIDNLDSDKIFYISEQLPVNWRIISKRTRKKILKKVLDLMDEGEIEANYLTSECQNSHKDILCKKLSPDIFALLESFKDDD
ncbi:hypothetical protein [Paenibacillus sp. FSL R7-0333]|uniref:hypothetical protein n=1 Tax=Paenibacillus sp. FSL R7-0333 TaxID=1926587 RepID=UPI0011807746